MFKRLLNYELSFIFLIFVTPFIYAVDKKNDLKDDFLNYHKKFDHYVNQMCSPDDLKKFQQLIKNYRDEGLYLPLSSPSRLDKKAVLANLTLFADKIDWIQKTIDQLKKETQLNSLEPELTNVRKLIDNNLKFKFEFYVSKKSNAKIEAKLQLADLKKEYDKLEKKLYYLQSFSFPVDHFKNRKIYETYKDQTTNFGKHQSNRIYFMRKILEDGTYNAQLQGSDLALRSLMDMVHLRLEMETDFLSLEIVTDLDWIIKKVKSFAMEGSHQIIKRMQDWLDRTQKAKNYYDSLLKMKHIDLKKHLKERQNSTFELQAFVANKQIAAYKYWSKEELRYQKYFVLDMILLHEVGSTDPTLIERKSIAQIIKNRSFSPTYSKIDFDQRVSHLWQKHKLKSSPWLNVLFKKGEFSFTYFYMPATIQMFCPDLSKKVKELRDENLLIAQQLIRGEIAEFRAMRYFSRISMFARLDMTSIWSKGYVPIENSLGDPIKLTKNQQQAIKNKKFRYLEKLNIEQSIYYLIEADSKKFVVDNFDHLNAYYYRDPDYFLYFSPVKKISQNTKRIKKSILP